MYQTVLFDVDGVMLSEERYFDASALTVYEILHSPQYLARPVEANVTAAGNAAAPNVTAASQATALPPFTVDLAEEHIRAIRRIVFADDAVLYAIKSRGVNANWDMVYLQAAMQIAYLVEAWVAQAGAAEVRAALEPAVANGWSRAALHTLGQHLAAANVAAAHVTAAVKFADFVAEVEPAADKAGLFAAVEAVLQRALPGITPFGSGRVLWDVCQQTFQEWYVGDAHVNETRQAGKKGFLTDEIALVDRPAFLSMLESLKAAGVSLGIATGRPELETMVPLDAIGWLQPFDRERITTASDVLNTERAIPEAAPLSKPNPFSYLRSYLRTRDVKQVLAHPLPLPADEAKKVLVVGDSVADFLAARAIGCDFAAVLTGLEGEGARPIFEDRGADHILSDALGVAGLFNL
ncbi:HAD family hydrolase [Alicyclobacillus sp. ALC3]|uniref:HAD family hydrolase n=1 Tax=Alicyclobacillus sp. ALC3 TaxID=2796143 RepID=UPI002379D381|nr:HAD hydrolase-like protein [Alicyclobacillus sp. ALC3]WDL97845.1 HAD family hydrolase [Alicyclobacillus sp. ALC3]